MEHSDASSGNSDSESIYAPYTRFQMRFALRLVLAGLITAIALPYTAHTGDLYEAEWYLILFLLVIGIGGGLYGGVRVGRWLRYRYFD